MGRHSGRWRADLKPRWRRAIWSNRTIRVAVLILVAPLTSLASVGCQGEPLKWHNPFKSAAEPAALSDADTAFTDISLVDATPVSASAQPRVFRVELSILHVKVPHSDMGVMQAVWNHLREDVLDSDTQLLLQRNGLRIGAGHVDDWQAIKAIFDGIEGSIVNQAPPMRLPEWVPLDLELDLEPAARMIFFLDRDGILSGAQWPNCRKYFKIAHAIDRRYPDRIHLRVMPQVRQEVTGKRWLRTPVGWTEVATYDGRSYPELAFKVELQAEQFLLLAPGKSADVAGLIGHVFMTEKLDDGDYDSYIFIRPTIQESTPLN